MKGLTSGSPIQRAASCLDFLWLLRTYLDFKEKIMRKEIREEWARLNPVFVRSEDNADVSFK